MKYFIDTEFLEGSQTKRIFGIPYGKTKPTIDMISVALVAEDEREYYAISKDFNLEEAWNRWQPRTGQGDRNNIEPKEYWIRENVLRPIYRDFLERECKHVCDGALWGVVYETPYEPTFCYKTVKYLLQKYGKSNAEIAEEVKDFIESETIKLDGSPYGVQRLSDEAKENMRRGYLEPIFYGYYADYDWVVFCWLFGKMIDLPRGFPMYCIDLKQELEGKISLMKKYKTTSTLNLSYIDFLTGKGFSLGEAAKIDWDTWFKEHPNYPRQYNEHNALTDARWNFKLHKFIQSL